MNPAKLLGINEDNLFTRTDEDCFNQILSRFQNWSLKDFRKENNKMNIKMFYCVNSNVPSRIQNGPSCGLVALRMASECLLNDYNYSSTRKSLIDVAKDEGMTKFGEMFSSLNMAKLSEIYYNNNIKCEVYTDIWDKEFISKMVIHLNEGNYLLIPYDASSNNDPCLNSGKSAHWAIIKGFIIGLQSSFSNIDKSNAVYDEFGTPFVYFDSRNETSKYDSNDLLRIIEDIDERCFWVISQQSKSKNQSIWKFSDLRDSNYNLNIYDENKSKMFNIDHKNLEGLRRKAIFIHKT